VGLGKVTKGEIFRKANPSLPPIIKGGGGLLIPKPGDELNLDVAKAEEASDPRRPGRSCIGIPRALENEGDEASYGFPGG